MTQIVNRKILQVYQNLNSYISKKTLKFKILNNFLVILQFLAFYFTFR